MLTWPALIAAILTFLEKLPELVALLRDLFNRATPEGSPAHLDSPAAVARLFAAARAQTWWFQWGKRARLAVAERVVSKRAGELALVAIGALPPALLTESEKAELTAG